MNRMAFNLIVILLSLLLCSTYAYNGASLCSEPSVRCIHSSKVFIMPIGPKMFNWTFSGEDEEQFSYRPSLLGAPDLPSWIQYTYSKRHHSGFVYGSPPVQETNFTLEIIGLNKENYNTHRRVVHLIILPKEEPAKHQVELKVDNLAVEDIFDSEHLDRLLNVFRDELWPEAKHDLHVTFLASAVQLGARLPLRPDEKEGVVIFLGSASKVSKSLLQLQDEVRPLYRLLKVGSCPRDFKRTTVDRLFRKQSFEMDWCAFRLTGANGKIDESHMHHNHHSLHYNYDMSLRSLDKTVWIRPFQEDVPQRSYVHEFLLSILVPMLIMILLVFLLSFILCFHHEGMDDGSSEYFDSIFDVCEDILGNKRNQETPAVQMVRYAAVQRASSTLRSLSTQRDPIPTSKFPSERDGVLRPQPPPYGIGLRNSGMDF